MRYFIWILRGLILLCLVILFIPAIRLRLFWIKPRLAVLIDASASMASPTKQSQWNYILKPLQEIESEAELETYSFSDSLRSVSFKNLTFNGSRTDISGAVKEACARNPDAILLVSDGRHNGPLIPDRLSSDIPLWSIAVGEAGYVDLSIEKVKFSDSGKLNVRVRSRGLPGGFRTVRLYADSRFRSMHRVQLAGEGLTEVSIPFTESGPPDIWRVEIDSVPDEDRTDNNSYSVRTAEKRRNVEILFLAGEIGAETEAILENLRRLPDLTLRTRIALTPQQVLDNSAGNPDVVVVVGLGTGPSPTLVTQVRNAVRRDLPVLLVSAGENLPEDLKNISPLRKQAGPAPGAGDIRTNTLGTLLLSEWTPEPVKPYQNYWSVSNDAEVLCGDGDFAFIARRGKIIGVEFPELVELINRDRNGFRAFLQHTLSYLADPEGFPFSFSIQKATEAAVELTVSSRVDVNEGNIHAWLEPDSAPLNIVPQSHQSFLATGVSPHGEKTFKIAWGGMVFTPRGKISIMPVPPEQPSRGANPELLEWLSSCNSGRMIEVEELDVLFDSLPRGKEIHYQPLGSPWLVIFLTFIFLGEIWYRRKTGLP